MAHAVEAHTGERQQMITDSSLPSEADIPLRDITDQTAALLDQTAAVLAPVSSRELRQAQRYLVKWRVTASFDIQGLHEGNIKDISIKGAAILLDQDLHSVEYIKLHIYMPPPQPSRIPCIISVLGKVVYSIHDSKEYRFRTGVDFMTFSTERDPYFLQKHLEGHALPAVF
jgi:hypothetical protein